MAAIVVTRSDLTAIELRAAAGREKDSAASRRMLALAMVFDGPTKRRRRLLKKLRRNARSKTPRSYQRKAARNLVPGRGAHWPARHADPCLGQTRDAPPCAARSALRMGLHFWRRLPAAP